MTDPNVLKELRLLRRQVEAVRKVATDWERAAMTCDELNAQEIANLRLYSKIIKDTLANVATKEAGLR